MAEKNRIIVVGSINMDLVAYTERIPLEGETVTGRDFQTHPGGKGANQAVAAARLGHPVWMIGRVGDDAFGAELRAHLENAGVDVSAVATSPCSSGVAVIVVSDRGENSIVVTPGANALLTPADLDRNIELLRSAGMVLTQLEIPLETIEHLARICVKEGLTLVLDPAPARPLPDSLLEAVGWFTPNETEAGFFTGEAATNQRDPAQIAQALLNRGVQGVVLKLGGRGAYLATRAGVRHWVSAFPVDAVDTTAAGDAFNGAFSAGLLMSKDPIESARFAAAAAALSVTRTGAQSSMPLLDEVEELLDAHLARHEPLGSTA